MEIVEAAGSNEEDEDVRLDLGDWRLDIGDEKEETTEGEGFTKSRMFYRQLYLIFSTNAHYWLV